MNRKATLMSLGAALVTVACVAVPDAGSSIRLRGQAQALFGVVQPVTAAEVDAPLARLGRALFWDKRISLDGKTACASCHAADDWSADRRALSINAKGQPTTMHSQPMFMAQDQFALRWYGDRQNGAQQAERSITGSMGFASAPAVVPVLKELGYEAAFRAAFGQEEVVTPTNYAVALAAYQRTLRTPAPFDAFLRGDLQALSPGQLAGLDKFIGYGCAGCHNGPLVGGNSFQKFGVVKEYWAATGSTKVDLGRFNATKKDEDKYVYRVPMLRNIAKTAPYFHDGSVASLDEAVRVMAEVQVGRAATPTDVADIVEFLGALTGAVPGHYAAPEPR